MGQLYIIIYVHRFSGGSVVKDPPAMQETQETWVWSLSQEDPLEEEMETHSSILAGKIPWTEEPGGLHSTGLQRVRLSEHACIHTHTYKKLSELY